MAIDSFQTASSKPERVSASLAHADPCALNTNTIAPIAIGHLCRRSALCKITKVSLSIVYRTRPKVGESANGDAGLVRRSDGHTMFAVIDALGHGVVAQSVADRARAALDDAPLEPGALSLIELVHQALKGTRGAALTVGVHSHGSRTIELAGVGNVQARSFSRSLPFIASPGVLGSRISRPRSTTIDLMPNETLLIASDGLPRRTSAALKEAPHADADALCDQLIAVSHEHDDATVMLVRLGGATPC